jgi:hypothetical protein
MAFDMFPSGGTQPLPEFGLFQQTFDASSKRGGFTRLHQESSTGGDEARQVANSCDHQR